MPKVQISDVVGLAAKLKTTEQFVPSDISTLVADYDFSDQTKYTYPNYTSEQVLLFSGMKDSSSAGNDLVQATGANQPTVVSYGGLNDLGYASFTSGKFISKTVTISAPITIFLVINIKNFVDGGVVLKLGSTTNGLYQKLNVYGDVTKHSFGPVNGAYQQNELYYPNKTIIVGFTLDSGGDGYQTTRILNGAFGNAFNKVVGGSGTSGVTKIQIGGDVDFDIYRCLIFSSNIGESNMRRVDSYLHRRYPVPSLLTYVAFGDSITYGAHSTSDLASYVFRVAQAKGFDGFTYALPGMDLGNFMRLNYRYAIERFNKDSYLSFCFGTNAGVSGVNSGWNDSYRTIIKAFIEAGFSPSRIILVTPPYTVTRAAFIATMGGYFAQMITDYGVKVADCFTATYNGGATMTDDDTHPLDTGHAAMAAQILAQIP